MIADVNLLHMNKYGWFVSRETEQVMIDYLSGAVDSGATGGLEKTLHHHLKKESFRER